MITKAPTCVYSALQCSAALQLNQDEIDNLQSKLASSCRDQTDLLEEKKIANYNHRNKQIGETRRMH